MLWQNRAPFKHINFNKLQQILLITIVGSDLNEYTELEW